MLSTSDPRVGHRLRSSCWTFVSLLMSWSAGSARGLDGSSRCPELGSQRKSAAVQHVYVPHRTFEPKLQTLHSAVALKLHRVT